MAGRKPVDPFVSCDWLGKKIDDESIIIADCRYDLFDFSLGEREYRKAHIPNAHFLHMEGVLTGNVGEHGGRHPIPDEKSFAKAMENIGLDNEKTVVAYDRDGSGAARLWWLLNYFGHDKVRILNGGYPLWEELNFPLTAKVPTVKSGNFRISRNGFILMEKDQLKLDSNSTIIDSRARERYEGVVEPIDTKAGHIPGSINIPYTEVLGKAGLFRDRSELEKIFADVDENPVLYCGSGVTSCVSFVALYSIGKNPRLYAGSWSDWISYDDNEIAVGQDP